MWSTKEGFTGGAVYTIAQSSDGYLWLGTERGLVRFDGSQFTLVRAPLTGQRPLGAVRGLIDDAYGNLWIRLDGPRLVKYRDGVFEDAVAGYQLFDTVFTAMSRDNAGGLLLWGYQERLLRFRGHRFEPVFPQDNADDMIISLLESSSGALWLGARDLGLYGIDHDRSNHVRTEAKLRSVNALAPSEHGGVWIGSETGLRLWEHDELVQLVLPPRLRNAQIFALVRDHNHNLWVGTDFGMYRIDPERRIVTGFYRSPDDSRISSIYEDHQGILWFAGSHGVECLRDGMFTSITSHETALKDFGGPLFADQSGRLWFAPVSGGLFCLEAGTVRRVTVPGLDNDLIYSIDGGGDELWLGRQRGGLTQLTRRGNKWLTRTFTQKDGLAQNSVYTVTRARDGTVWAGTVSGGVSVLRHGEFKTYTVNNGLESNAIFSSLEAADHKMWFASPSGLLCFDGLRWTTHRASDTGSTLNLRTVFEDSSHVLWLGTSHGLAIFQDGHVQALRDLPPLLNEEILSIGEDAQGFLWVTTAQHVLEIDRSRLMAGILTDEDLSSYGSEDGLTETEGARRDRSLVSDSSGRIWISLLHSFAVADANAAEAYRKPVEVRIESIAIEGLTSRPGKKISLPSDTRSITFQYAGTSLVTPGATRFRYRLDGLDQTWSAGAASRQVVYTHLSPASYTFRIMAANAFGVWNGPEADIAFTVQPAFWQTWYFRVLSMLMIAVFASALYRLRLMQVTGRLNRRFQDRLAERTRIAQDLHDTLLQGVISASMQLDVAQDYLPGDSLAKPMLARVLELMRQVTDEGREALRGLRTTHQSLSMEMMFRGMVSEVRTSSTSRNLVHVQGRPRLLRIAVMDEVYRIGREAYINAVAHAGAKRIEITLLYELRAFRLVVSDDGCGISAGMPAHGPEGHRGLAGMREGAAAVGSDLTIHTRTPGGTDVRLRVPAAIAYADASSRRITWPWRLRKG